MAYTNRKNGRTTAATSRRGVGGTRKPKRTKVAGDGIMEPSMRAMPIPNATRKNSKVKHAPSPMRGRSRGMRA